jgi:hypothetical protein
MSKDDLRVLELINSISLLKDKLEYYEELPDNKQIRSIKDAIKKLEKELSKLDKQKDY